MCYQVITLGKLNPFEGTQFRIHLRVTQLRGRFPQTVIYLRAFLVAIKTSLCYPVHTDQRKPSGR